MGDKCRWQFIVPLTMLASPAVGLAADATPPGPSFNCAVAKTADEKLICSDDALASVDRTLSNIYHGRLDQIGGKERTKFVTDQRTWVGKRNADCGIERDTDVSGSSRFALLRCLRNAYLARIVDLLKPPARLEDSAPLAKTADEDRMCRTAVDRLRSGEKQPYAHSIEPGHVVSGAELAARLNSDPRFSEIDLDSFQFKDAQGVWTYDMRGQPPVFAIRAEYQSEIGEGSVTYFRFDKANHAVELRGELGETCQLCNQTIEHYRVGDSFLAIGTRESQDQSHIIKKHSVFHLGTSDAMKPFCIIEARYAKEYGVEENDGICNGSFCLDFRKALPGIAAEFETTGRVTYGDAGGDRALDEKVAALDARGDLNGVLEPPNAYYTAFSNDEASYLFAVPSSDGMYIGKIGGSQGARSHTLDGYLVGVYRLAGNAASPVAGFVIQRKSGRVSSVKILR